MSAANLAAILNFNIKAVSNILGKYRNDISDPSNLVVDTSITALGGLKSAIYRVLSIWRPLWKKGDNSHKAATATMLSHVFQL